MTWAKKWELIILWLFHALVIVVPFIFTWVNEELFEFNKMLAVYGFTIAIGLSWICKMIAEQSISIKRSWFDIFVWLFVGSQVLSTVFSIHPATSWFGYYTRFHGGLLSTLSYTLLYYAFVSVVNPTQLKSFLKTLVLAAVGISAYAIPEHFGLSPSCVLITGEISSGVTCWVQDVQTRVFATFGQPNWLAAYFITVLPLMWYLLADAITQKKNSALIWMAAPIAIGAATLFTKSRSGFVGLAAGLAVWLGGLLAYFHPSFPKENPDKNTHIPTILLLPVLLVALPSLIWGTPFSPNLKSLLTPASTPSELVSLQSPTPQPVANRLDEGGTDSGEIRKIVWEGAINVWKRYPLFGSGVETFAYSYYLDRPLAHNTVSEWDFLYNKAHNEFLNYLATTGVVGLSTYVAFLGAIVVLAYQTWRNHTPDAPYLSLAVVSSLVALSVSNFFGFSTVMVGVLLYLLPAFLVVTQHKPNTVLAVPWLNSSTGPVIGFASLLIALWLGWSTISMWRGDHLYTLGKAFIAQGAITEGLDNLRASVEVQPNQALFHDELASVYSALARQLSTEQQATVAAQLAEAAILSSNKALQLNDTHLNFYKTRARVLINLGTLNPEFLTYAEDTLLTASKLAPTDPKIIYNLGLVAEAINQPEKAQTYLEKAVELKPDYLNALAELGLVYEVTGQLEKSRDTYQQLLKYNPQDELIKTKLDTVNASISAKTTRN